MYKSYFMQWYLAKIVFRIICGEGNHTPQFDEQLRLIYAAGEAQAFEKANEIGKEEQVSFLNQKHQEVLWQFINVSELHKLASLTDGLELYSKVQEADNAVNYIDIVNRKAEGIRTSFRKKSSSLAI